jgi:hypothetical protein
LLFCRKNDEVDHCEGGLYYYCISFLWSFPHVLHTTLCDKVCQWLVAGQPRQFTLRVIWFESWMIKNDIFNYIYAIQYCVFYLSNGYLTRLNYCTIINSHWFYGFAKQNISCFFLIYLKNITEILLFCRTNIEVDLCEGGLYYYCISFLWSFNFNIWYIFLDIHCLQY